MTSHNRVARETLCEAPLGEILTNAKRGLSSSYQEDGDTNVRLIKAKDINENGTIIVPSVDETKVKKTASLKNATVSAGDVIITLKGSSFKAATVEEDAEGFVISANLISMTCKPHVVPEFLTLYLNSQSGQNQLKKSAGGSVIMSLNMEFLKALTIPVPPFDKQKQIVACVRQVQEYADLLEKEKDLLGKISDHLFSMDYSIVGNSQSYDTTRDGHNRGYEKFSGVH